MLAIILNIVLCCAVTVVVVSPLVWAILTQHNDPAAGGTAGRTPKAAPRTTSSRACRQHAVASRLG